MRDNSGFYSKWTTSVSHSLDRKNGNVLGTLPILFVVDANLQTHKNGNFHTRRHSAIEVGNKSAKFLEISNSQPRNHQINKIEKMF